MPYQQGDRVRISPRCKHYCPVALPWLVEHAGQEARVLNNYGDASYDVIASDATTGYLVWGLDLTGIPHHATENDRIASGVTNKLKCVESRKVVPPYCLVKSYRFIGARRQGGYAKLSFWPVLWVKTCSYLIKLAAKGILVAPRWFFCINETQFGRFQAQTGTTL